MRPTSAAPPASKSPPVQAPEAHLGGRTLALAHAAWIAVVLLDAAIFIPGVPAYAALLRVPCTSVLARLGCNPGQLSPGAIHALIRMGISLDAYAALALGLVVVTSLVLFAVGGLIAWRKWDEGMGLFVSLVLITLGATGISDTLLNALSPEALPLGPVGDQIMRGLGSAIIYLQWPAFAAFLLTFPNGRFAPRWSWLVILLWLAVEVAFLLAALQLVIVSLITIAIAATLAVQVYRYRRVYGPVERQQTKWLVFSIAAAVTLSAVITLGQALALALGAPGSSSQATALLVSVAFFLPVALAIGIAILRYRLYDIDLIINRALVYGSLTVTLGVVYVAVVLGAQSLIEAWTGQRGQQPIVIVATTLLIAGLFNPLRHRLQDAIDRRFYRHKYDAARTIQRFGDALRTETDLARLSEYLLSVVRDTMEPEHVSLWLQPMRPAPKTETLPASPLRQSQEGRAP